MHHVTEHLAPFQFNPTNEIKALHPSDTDSSQEINVNPFEARNGTRSVVYSLPLCAINGEYS